jgi:hypothetical protein
MIGVYGSWDQGFGSEVSLFFFSFSFFNKYMGYKCYGNEGFGTNDWELFLDTLSIWLFSLVCYYHLLCKCTVKSSLGYCVEIWKGNI